MDWELQLVFPSIFEIASGFFELILNLGIGIGIYYLCDDGKQSFQESVHSKEKLLKIMEELKLEYMPVLFHFAGIKKQIQQQYPSEDVQDKIAGSLKERSKLR